MDGNLLFQMMTVLQIAIDEAGLLGEVMKSGLLQGVLLFGCYTLWRELKSERSKNDIMTDKVITNNITMQEQLKDLIELIKSKNHGSIN
jgi:hypothetical protein